MRGEETSGTTTRRGLWSRFVLPRRRDFRERDRGCFESPPKLNAIEEEEEEEEKERERDQSAREQLELCAESTEIEWNFAAVFITFD